MIPSEPAIACAWGKELNLSNHHFEHQISSLLSVSFIVWKTGGCFYLAIRNANAYSGVPKGNVMWSYKLRMGGVGESGS